MNPWLDTVLVLLILTNLYLLGSSRISACIRTVAGQAVLLGIISLLAQRGDVGPAAAAVGGRGHGHQGRHPALAAAARRARGRRADRGRAVRGLHDVAAAGPGAAGSGPARCRAVAVARRRRHDVPRARGPVHDDGRHCC